MLNELKPRELPLRKGDDPVFMRCNHLLACAWHDTKRLMMLSTVHDNSCITKRIRAKNTGDGFRDISKPSCVDTYSCYMGGVDTAD